MLGLEAMDQGKTVFSNYPIYNDKTRQYSKIWLKSYAYDTILNSVIIDDEAYQDYSSRGSGAKYAKNTDEGFTKDEHAMFCQCRHNDNDYILIAQNFARVDTIVREAAIFYKIEPVKIPLTDILVAFVVKSYMSENFVNTDKSEGYEVKLRIPFVSMISRAFRSFNTKFYRRAGQMRTDYPAWTGKETINDYLKIMRGEVPCQTKTETKPQDNENTK